jgi:hypothetical protein
MSRLKGYKHSEVTKQKIGDKHRGKIISEEQKEKQSETMEKLYASDYKPPMLGRAHSDEAKEKIRQARLGKHISEFSKQRVRETQIGRIVSEETRKRMSDSKRGLPLSDMHKLKLKEAARVRWLDKDYRRIQIEKRIGKNNPRWLGGLSYNGYDSEFSRPFKKLIRQRDNYICSLCKTHQEKLSRTLHVHHADYNKKLCIKENCLSLCQSCHNLTNDNREFWTTFFQSLLSKKYGYQYSENKEVIINLDLKGGLNK